jgi:hypothetical protein
VLHAAEQACNVAADGIVTTIGVADADYRRLSGGAGEAGAKRR